MTPLNQPAGNDGQPSPIAAIVEELRTLNASWSMDLGHPSGSGWISGTELRDATTGPFLDLLERIGRRAGTGDRRTIAASFALRYGWASAMGIAPYMLHDCVPDLSLENISLKFRESTFLERTALHEARGAVLADTRKVPHATVTLIADRRVLLRILRSALSVQAAPVVDALHAWAGFSKRGSWGLLTSSWAAHFTSFYQGTDQRDVWPVLQAFFAGDDIVTVMQPRVHAVTCGEVTHLYQRRGSCCRWYLLPTGELCASCPLVSHEQRLLKNRAWMEAQLNRSGKRPGHS